MGGIAHRRNATATKRGIHFDCVLLLSESAIALVHTNLPGECCPAADGPHSPQLLRSCTVPGPGIHESCF